MKKLSGYLKVVRNIFYLFLIRLFYRKQKFDKKYYVSVCAIFKNEGKYLREWIEYHLTAGVEHFICIIIFRTTIIKRFWRRISKMAL